MLLTIISMRILKHCPEPALRLLRFYRWRQILLLRNLIMHHCHREQHQIPFLSLSHQSIVLLENEMAFQKGLLELISEENVPTGCFFSRIKVVSAEFADAGIYRVTDEVK